MADIKIISYNIRCDVESDGINSFTNRRGFIKKRLPAYNADIIGFQETKPHMRAWLIENLPEYEFCGVGRGKNFDDESNVIAFRRAAFDMLSTDTFWLSDTPRVPGSRFATDQSVCPRICTCVTLLHKESGRLLRHYNTHLDHEGATAQAQGITVVLNRVAADYAANPLPVILTGDFNIEPNTPVYRSVQAFGGCGTPLADTTADMDFTFHDFKPQNEKSRIKIDYIFTTLPFDASHSFKADDEENGVYLSDHYPVGAILKL